MKKLNKKIIAVIPARLGSVRVKAKNLRMLGGRPLIYYIIRTLKDSKMIDQIYINSESEIFASIAERYGVEFYKRATSLATSESMIDDYIYDFCKNTDCDILAVANPTSPFLSTKEVDEALDNFINNDFDTQLACEDIKTHCFYNDKAINFSLKGQHPRSQDLIPVKALNFAITIWKKNTFINSYQKNGYGVYSGKIGYYSLSGISNVDIDWEDDFILAENIIKNLKQETDIEPEYDPLINDLIKSGKNICN
tara:strand:+ start:1346 stop:2101 length:756 start_codon:yes stop_codon:yes gene_type:complete